MGKRIDKSFNTIFSSLYPNFDQEEIKNSKKYFDFIIENFPDRSEIIQKISSQNKNLNAKKRIQEIDHNLQLPWEFLYITDLSLIHI